MDNQASKPRRIYFDNAATTRVRKEVFEAMRPYLDGEFGNPSSVYEEARNAKKAVETARAQVAKVLNAGADEIYFTGSGSEADNWALRGVAESYAKKGKHIITSAIEHHAVLHTCEYLEKHGYEVTYIPVDEYGQVSAEAVKNAIRDDTVLISVMFANNEIGTLQPIAEIGAIAHEKGVLFHTDAVQAFGHEPIDVKAMNIDLLSLSGHKLGAPKGIGALYIRKGVKITPLIFGGAQERGKRAGTENVPYIVGLGVAAELANAEMSTENERLRKIRDKISDGILKSIPYAKLNGHPTNRIAGTLNISFEFIEGESMLLLLDMKGISASSGSACTSGSLDPSHVLLAIGLPHEKAHGSLRISLSRYNTEEDADYLLAELPAIVQRLRDMSPLYEHFLKTKKQEA